MKTHRPMTDVERFALAVEYRARRQAELAELVQRQASRIWDGTATAATVASLRLAQSEILGHALYALAGR